MRLAGSTKIEWDPEKQMWFRQVWVIFEPGCTHGVGSNVGFSDFPLVQ